MTPQTRPNLLQACGIKHKLILLEECTLLFVWAGLKTRPSPSLFHCCHKPHTACPSCSRETQPCPRPDPQLYCCVIPQCVNPERAKWKHSLNLMLCSTPACAHGHKRVRGAHVLCLPWEGHRGWALPSAAVWRWAAWRCSGKASMRPSREEGEGSS